MVTIPKRKKKKKKTIERLRDTRTTDLKALLFLFPFFFVSDNFEKN